MAFVKKALKVGMIALAITLTFGGALLLSAAFAKFVISTPPISVTLGSQESSNFDVTISFDPSFTYGTGTAPYAVTPSPHCNSYDADSNCVDSAPDLCPYLALQPKEGEATEIGFSQHPFGSQATGVLNHPVDESDTWNLIIKSPCFEGECPADYDQYQNGYPLPQSMKGQVFKCDLGVRANDLPPLVQNFLNKNTAYADNFSSILQVSATLTGEVKGCITDCFSNVLFLPGIEASRLYMSRPDGSEDQLWEPNTPTDINALYLNTDGTSINHNVYTKDILKETNTPIPSTLIAHRIYKSFSDTIDQLMASHKINAWEPFAYDWRQGVDDIVNNGTSYKNGNVSLVATMQSLVDSSKNGKVTIVAHSNGGLLAKALLKKLQADKDAGLNNLIDHVDVLILVASPEIGTASAVPAVMHGYDQSLLWGWLMDEINARELGRNMLGAYGLLPSKAYINHVSASPTTFVDTVIPSNVSTKLVQTFGSAISSYDEYKSFLFGGEGRTNPSPSQTNLPISLSQNLFSKAESLHDSIDPWTPPSGMKVIEVAGWGKDTVASFEYYPKSDCSGISCTLFLDERPRFTFDGDGTVVVPSAQYTSFLGGAEKHWINLLNTKNDHSNILEAPSLLEFITNTIQNLPENNFADITTTTPVDTSNRLRLSIHSPVTIDAYDANGNHTGKICPVSLEFCYKEENIPNSSYLEFGEGKYLNLPEDKAKRIRLQGTDVGTFTYDSEKVLPNGTSTTSSFVDIPVTTQTQAEVTLNSVSVPQLALDVTGDGVTDFTLAPSNTFDPITYLQVMKATVDSLDISKDKIKVFDNRVDNIIKLIQRGKIDKAKLKADKFKSVLEKKLAKPDPKHPKLKKLSKTDAQLLLDMLNKLLDNLN